MSEAVLIFVLIRRLFFFGVYQILDYTMACSAISRPELRNILQQRVACKIAISEEQKCGLLSAGVLLCLSNVSNRLQEATVENFECVLKIIPVRGGFLLPVHNETVGDIDGRMLDCFSCTRWLCRGSS